MLKEETWGIAIDRARRFFREQPDVQEETPNCFRHGSCAVTLTELKPKGMGVWAAKRCRVRFEGDDADTEAIYHRFFIQFLSTGG